MSARTVIPSCPKWGHAHGSITQYVKPSCPHKTAWFTAQATVLLLCHIFILYLPGQERPPTLIASRTDERNTEQVKEIEKDEATPQKQRKYNGSISEPIIRLPGNTIEKEDKPSALQKRGKNKTPKTPFLFQKLLNDERLADFINGPISVIIDGNSNNNTEIIREFYFDDARIIREYRRERVHFDILDDSGRKTGEFRYSEQKGAPQLVLNEPWYFHGYYEIRVDVAFSERAKAGDVISTVKQMAQRGRVFFYDTKKGTRLDELDLAARESGTFRTFALLEDKEALAVKSGTINDILAYGGKEIVSGQNAIKAKVLSATFERDSAGNQYKVEEKLNDTEDARMILEISGREFDTKILAMKLDHIVNLPVWVCYEDKNRPGTFRVAEWNIANKTWSDSEDAYKDEDTAFDAIDKAAILKAEDENWYDSEIFGGRKALRIEDKVTRQEIRYHIDVLKNDLYRLQQNKKKLEDKIKEINSEQAAHIKEWLDGQFASESFKPTDFYITNVLNGWGYSTRNALKQGEKIEAISSDRLRTYESLDDLMKSVRKDGSRNERIYWDTKGTKDEHDDTTITFGMKTLDYKISLIESQLKNASLTIKNKGFRDGMVILTDMEKGSENYLHDEIAFGRDAVRQYQEILTSLLKEKGADAIKYDRAANKFEMVRNVRTCMVTIVLGYSDAIREIQKIQEEYKKAILYSQNLKESCLEFKK